MKNSRNRAKARRQRNLAQKIAAHLWAIHDEIGSQHWDAVDAARTLIPVYAALAAQNYARLGRNVLLIDSRLNAALGYQTPERALADFLPVWGEL